MTATPLLMPTRRVNHAAVIATRPVYSTATGDAPRPAPADRAASATVAWDEAFCFVCGRCTEHAGEHDALVEAGLAAYGRDGSVYRTDAWDTDLAREVQEAEYQALYGHLG